MDKKFDDLIRRYQSGTCTDQEKALVEKWLASREGSKQSEKLSTEEREKLLAEVSASLFEKIEQTKSGKQITMFPVWRMAAAILLLAVASFIVWKFTKTDSLGAIETIQASAAGDEIKKVILSDGSIIWLKDNGTLTYPEKFTGKERNVTVTGEALFEVAKDAEHPFNITIGGMKVTVLGTSFNIKETAANIELLVLTGRVSVSSTNNNQNIIVMPNEKIRFDIANQQLAKVKPVEEETTQVVSQTEYSMNFRDTRMEEVIRRIEGKFDISVSLEDKRIGNCMITVNLTDQSVERTMETASQILGFSYEIKNNQITIRGSGCD